MILRRLRKILKFLYCKTVKANDTFFFNGKPLKYFWDWYNFTPDNERAIEIPIVLDEIGKLGIVPGWQSERDNEVDILEVGNVLNHYVTFKHDVVDFYEKAPGVINEDICTFNPNKKYDLIVSVSTLEHLPTENLDQAIKNIKSLLKPGGKAVITVPVGFNYYFNENRFDKLYTLKRLTENEWEQISPEYLNDVKYGYPYKAANGLLVGIRE
jgi:SAM-dependent methyltransferase